MKIKEPKQLQFEIIAETNRAMPTTQDDWCKLMKHIIELYGKEFEKANDEIARLRSETDELFQIKQKIVIANIDLMRKNAALVKENEKLRKDLIEKLHIEYQKPKQ